MATAYGTRKIYTDPAEAGWWTSKLQMSPPSYLGGLASYATPEEWSQYGTLFAENPQMLENRYKLAQLGKQAEREALMAPALQREEEIKRRKSEIESSMFDPLEYANEIRRRQNLEKSKLAAEESDVMKSFQSKSLFGGNAFAQQMPQITENTQGRGMSSPMTQQQLFADGSATTLLRIQQQKNEEKRQEREVKKQQIEASMFDPSEYANELRRMRDLEKAKLALEESSVLNQQKLYQPDILKRQQDLERKKYDYEMNKINLSNKMMSRFGAGLTAGSALGVPKIPTNFSEKSWITSYSYPKFPY